MKCGYVAVVGKANAGKSTLINVLVGEKVAIVSPKPHTTRNRILAVCNVWQERKIGASEQKTNGQKTSGQANRQHRAIDSVEQSRQIGQIVFVPRYI